jgi:ParB-like chromosome segregation protein Spo0J
MVDLAKYQRQLSNPKDHDLQAIARSLKRFGFVDPVVVNETTGHIVAGHGRVDALQSMKARGDTPPKNITASGGAWLVPTWFVEVAEKDEGALGIALNKTTELGGWREDILASVLSDIAARDETLLLATGFDKDDVDALLAFSQNTDMGGLPEEPAPSVDDAETYRLTIVCKTKDDLDMLIGALDADVADTGNGKNHVVPFERLTLPGVDSES